MFDILEPTTFSGYQVVKVVLVTGLSLHTRLHSWCVTADLKQAIIQFIVWKCPLWQKSSRVLYPMFDECFHLTGSKKLNFQSNQPRTNAILHPWLTRVWMLAGNVASDCLLLECFVAQRCCCKDTRQTSIRFFFSLSFFFGEKENFSCTGRLIHTSHKKVFKGNSSQSVLAAS